MARGEKVDILEEEIKMPVNDWKGSIRVYAYTEVRLIVTSP